MGTTHIPRCALLWQASSDDSKRKEKAQRRRCACPGTPASQASVERMPGLLWLNVGFGSWSGSFWSGRIWRASCAGVGGTGSCGGGDGCFRGFGLNREQFNFENQGGVG